MHLREFKVDTMTARRASSSPQAVVQTLFRNLLFLLIYCSLFTRQVYYLRTTTSDLLPSGYYPARSDPLTARSARDNGDTVPLGGWTGWSRAGVQVHPGLIPGRIRGLTIPNITSFKGISFQSKDVPVLFCGALSSVDNARLPEIAQRSGHGANPHGRHP